MLTLTLATLMLTTTAAPVQARLELSPDDDQLRLRLCFSSSQPHPLTYHLEVRTNGRAGTSRSRQSGELISGPMEQCPLNNRLGLADDSRIEATLTWTVDGQEQPPLHQAYPATQPASPVPPEPALPPLEEPRAPGELFVNADSHLR
ncbi:curli-like amyloid fiber formation chaperone CsgH [Stutzerimonas stutzeri]|uniref:curli-like amyloid fiber formation chaperone CsgH n=1 Tax=Stutzerimonas stutzeri TaxID=316 RepID=UPI0020C6EBDD|nr:curli-like amyloid fiber formation chaperone CsgH [Stutzerimonas stutzeri]